MGAHELAFEANDAVSRRAPAKTRGIFSRMRTTTWHALDSIFSRWDTAGVAALVRPWSPGCAVAILNRHELVAERYFGWARSGQVPIPVGPATVFELSSVSKQFTACAVALLAMRRALRLDDRIASWFPELEDRGVLVRHLIHHTSGYPDLFRTLPHDQRFDASLALRKLAGSPLEEPPGTRYRYNNSGYVLAALLVERISGLRFDRFVRTHLFEPMGMAGATIGDMAARAVVDHQCAFGYNRVPSSTAANPQYQLDMWPRSDAVGSGGALMTLRELALWDRGIQTARLGDDPVDLCDGEPPVPLTEALVTPGRFDAGPRAGQPVRSSNDGEAYAFGLEVGTWQGRRLAWHNGGSYGYRSLMLRLPEEELTVLILSNAGSAFDAWLAQEGFSRPPNLSIRNLAEHVADLTRSAFVQAG